MKRDPGDKHLAEMVLLLCNADLSSGIVKHVQHTQIVLVVAAHAVLDAMTEGK